MICRRAIFQYLSRYFRWVGMCFWEEILPLPPFFGLASLFFVKFLLGLSTFFLGLFN